MNVREIAFRVLRIVEKRRFVPREELDPALSRMEDRDRAFLKELVWGVLRRRVYLDWIINRFLNKKDIPPSIRIILRMGAYQILFMDGVPDYAAVNESVKLVRLKSFKGLVNAVLRKIASTGYLEPEEIHLKYSHPKWISDILVENFGHENAIRIMENHLKPLPLVLRVNKLKIDRETFMERYGYLDPKPTPHSPFGVTVEYNGPTDELEPVLKGYATVQGESSQVIPLILDLKPGMRILDACASPGGKTTHMAELIGDEGEIVAIDVSVDKVERVVESAKRLGLKSIKTAVADSRKIHELFDEEFDLVLVDAPCTSLGTARKNPEVLMRVKEKDIKKMSEVQKEILESSWRVLKPGGMLMYSVCTFTKEETVENIRWFLENHEADLKDPREKLKELGVEFFWDGFGFLILPDETMTEFYASVLRKVKR